MRDIVHRRRETSGSWSSFTTFSSNDDEYLKPSIGSHFNIGNNNDLEVVWYVLGTNQLKLARYINSSWTQYTQTPVAQFPAMSQNLGSATPKARIAYRSVSGTPYTLAISSQNLPKTVGQSIVHHRRGVLGLGGAELVFELGEFEVGGTEIKLFPYVDTLAVGHTGKWEDMFRTESFQVINQTNLGFSRSWTVVNPARLKSILPDNAKASFQLEAVDASTQKALNVIDQQDITNNPALPSEEKKNVVFNLAGSKEIFLRVAWSVPAGVKVMPAMVESYREAAPDSVTEKTVANSTVVQLTPTKFKLSQNYPNPFNPSTLIHFTLPEPAQVRLRILNLMGEQVRSLFVGNKSAGAFTEIWDGKNGLGKTVSSGVYISQLEVVSFTGQSWVMTKKMLLMR